MVARHVYGLHRDQLLPASARLRNRRVLSRRHIAQFELPLRTWRGARDRGSRRPIPRRKHYRCPASSAGSVPDHAAAHPVRPRLHQAHIDPAHFATSPTSIGIAVDAFVLLG
jgi:hypothetical protein